MSFERELDFKVGNGLFRKLWVTAPASTRVSDGLGPLYNARSCQSCHLKDGRAHPPAGPDDPAVGMFLRLSVPAEPGEMRPEIAEIQDYVGTLPDPVYGGQLQDFSIAGIPAEGRMAVDYVEEPVTLGDGSVVSLRRPSYRIADPAYGPPSPELMLSPRVAPQMIGLGLLEAVPEEDILALADPEDADGDGISGRPNLVLVRGDRRADARALRLEGRAADDPRAVGLGLLRRHRHLDARCCPTAGASAARRRPPAARRRTAARPRPTTRCSTSSPSTRATSRCRRGATSTTRRCCAASGCSTRRAAPPATPRSS